MSHASPSREVVGAVLCAGLGSRLRPLTDVLPKPLLPFLNTPLVMYALDHLARAGVRRVALNLHHLAEHFPPVVDRLCAALGMEPVYVVEPELLGTAGGIRGLWAALGEPDATMMVLNGDSVMNLDARGEVERHWTSGAAVSLVVRPRAPEQPGRVWLDAQGRIVGLRAMRLPGAPADSGLVEHDFTGVHLLERSVLARLPRETSCMVGDVYGPDLMRGVAPRAAVVHDFWAALDSPALFLETTREVLDHPGRFAQAPWPGDPAAGLHLCSAKGIDNQALFAPPAFLGLSCEVGAGARVGPHVVMDGTRLAPGAETRNAVLWGMGTVDGTWQDCIAVAGRVAQV